MAKKIDWKNLGFKYMQTGHYVTAKFAKGKWGRIQVCTDPHLTLHVAATCLHYGQACFEGLKAFCGKDGKVAIFRPDQNAQRLISTAKRLVMQPPPQELFLSMAAKLVSLNKAYVPPYGTDASLYLRPFLLGTSPHIGVHPSEDYLLVMLATPMGAYYKNGFFPVKAYIQEDYDRAAPRGVGNVKAAGNYAAGMMGDLDGKKKGFPICLYLDSAERRYIDEFGTSNFIAITRDGRYVTPDSSSVLPSVTNHSLQDIAADFGLAVERRRIRVEELADFAEVGACGTAVVITPVSSIKHGKKTYVFGAKGKAGPMLTGLYNEIKGIQYGEIPDRHGWMYKVNGKKRT
jgi:branched-chain amino acid aminotransferase